MILIYHNKNSFALKMFFNFLPKGFEGLGKALKTFSQEIKDLNWHTQSSKDVLKNLNPDYRESLTPNAVVVGNMIPSYFPCCPQEKSENPLQEYFTRLQPSNVYYMNSKYKVLVQQTAICSDKIIIKCESGDGENAIKPWSVSIISYENGLYVHEL